MFNSYFFKPTIINNKILVDGALITDYNLNYFKNELDETLINNNKKINYEINDLYIFIIYFINKI